MANIYCAWDISLRVVCILSVTLLDKNVFFFSFLRGFHLETVWMGTHVYFPSQCWETIWLEPMQAVQCCHRLSEFICSSDLLCMEDTLFLVSVLISASLTIFLLPLQSSLSPEGRDLMKAYHLWPSIPSFLTQHIVQLRDCTGSHLMQEEALMLLADIDIALLENSS